MKILFSVLLFACVGHLILDYTTGHKVDTTELFYPTKVPFETLLQDGDTDSSTTEALVAALTQVGMISITNVPFLSNKEITLQSFSHCAETSPVDFVVDLTFADGTLRRTMATHTSAGISAPLKIADTTSCSDFNDLITAFRQTVTKTTNVFATFLSAALKLQEPLLYTKQDEPFELPRLVKEGEHLEHFHYYSNKIERSSNDDQTIEWHTDQGLFLVFTPGLIEDIPSNGFYIELQDGSVKQVKFDNKDDLVIMLGDGVNQVINQALASPLRALPHALYMPNESMKPRVWYGRMVLPPPDALHPTHHHTFGNIRQTLIKYDATPGAYALGCSASLTVRQLHENTSATCEDNAYYCWHTCMNYTDYNVTPAICDQRQLTLSCTNAEGQVWDRAEHGDFYITCANLTAASNDTSSSDMTNGADTSTSSAMMFTLGMSVAFSLISVATSMT